MIPSCIPVREVEFQMRHKRTRHVSVNTLWVPVPWTRSQVLAYVRAVHPNVTVKIRSWGDITELDNWIPNPRAFKSYRNGVMA